MITIGVTIILAFFGAVFGSFAGAQVWRLRQKQLEADKREGVAYDKQEYKRLKKLHAASVASDRSRCLHCGHVLTPFELIPIVSWVVQKGKCRACKKSIGWFEPILEIGTALYFVGLFLFWPLGLTSPIEIIHFGLWLVAGVVFAVLIAYDAKWFLLPDRYNLALAVVGLAAALLVVLSAEQPLTAAVNVLGSVAAIAGLYGLLYVLSGGRWVGFGDVKLGVGLGLLLADWRLALLAVFLANLIGTLIVLPLLATKRMSRADHVPFGPMLIIGTVLAWLFGTALLTWYLGGLGLY